MEELRTDILPRLCTFTDNPVLLVEESHQIGDRGYLFRKDERSKMFVETELHATSYFGFLESARMIGINVVCTRSLDQSIWYMISMDGYLSREHYPKPLKSYKPHQQALGMLCCVPGIGIKRATAALQERSIDEMCRKECTGLTKGQQEKIRNVLRTKL